jgi:SNF2 family DNA or RNA helicase
MEIRVEKVGNRIHLKSGYRADIPEFCRSINGYSWLQEKKIWSFPLDFGTCLRLRECFKHELKIGPDLKAWARQEKKRHEELVALTSEIRADLGFVSKVSPALANAMGNRPYQQIGSAWLARARQALLADHPGLGKTLQAMGAIVEAQITGPILVFAPKTAAIITWTEELKKWLPNDMVYCVTALNGQKRHDALADIEDFYTTWRLRNVEDWADDGIEPRMWVLCNIEMARAKVFQRNSTDADGNQVEELFQPKYPGIFNMLWSTVIVDESHNGLITKYSQIIKMPQTRAGMAKIPLREGALKFAMSGTPMRGKPYNLWGTLNWLRPDLYPSYWRWVTKYFDTFDNGYGLIIGGFREGMEEQFNRDLETIMLRRTKSEVLAELPPKEYAGIRLENQEKASAPGHWIEMDPMQAKTYQMVGKDAAVRLEGGNLLPNGALSLMTRQKQFASASARIDEDGNYQPCLPSNKFDWLVQFLTERGISGEDEYGDGKVIVATQFTRLANLFHRELEAIGIKAHLLTGEVSPNKRKVLVTEFQGLGGPRVFILNTKAGGVSLTLDAADDVVILDETWNPDDQEQVEDRAHRASRMHSVTIHYVRSLGTIEEEIAVEIGEREGVQKAILDGRRGVDYAKKLLGVK